MSGPLFKPPHWSKDPEEKHFAADYTIKLKGEYGKEVAVYRVHKFLLLKHSGLFNCVFQQSAFTESKTNEYSMILAQEKAFAAFPSLLDYLYSDNNKEVVEEEPKYAVALGFFSDYLDIQPLRDQVDRFFNQHFRFDYDCPLDLEDCGMYLRDAVEFKNEWLMDRVARFVAKKCHWIETYSKLTECLDLQFWMSVKSHITTEEWSDEISGSHLPDLFAKVCSNLINVLDEASFSSLTRELQSSFMSSFISVEAAIELLAVAAKVAPDTAGSSTTAIQLTTLQRTCVQALELRFNEMHLMYWSLRKKLSLDQGIFVLDLVAQRADAARDAERADKVGFPKSIIVNGAGTPDVNGRYVLVDFARADHPGYRMDGTWEDERAVFTLDFEQAQNDGCRDCWLICVEKQTDSGDFQHYETFYSSNPFTTGNRTDKFPPTFSWWIGHRGAEPAPTIEYEYPDGNDE